MKGFLRLPTDIEKYIVDDLGIASLNLSTIKQHRKTINKLQKQMHKLSDDFRHAVLNEDLYAEAYLCYNFPVNLLKVKTIVTSVRNIYPDLVPVKKLRILDIGCGPGPGMLGVFYSLPNIQEFYFTGIDASLSRLKKCRCVLHSIKKKNIMMHVRLLHKKISKDFIEKKSSEYNIIILANALAEIIPEQEIPVVFIERLLKCCAPNGIIVIMEPGTKILSRRLMTLRNKLSRKQRSWVLLPCLGIEECSLYHIRSKKEWCHQSIRWQPPDYLKIINQGLRREIDVLKFSYLVIGKKQIPWSGKKGFLVTSPLLSEKGKKKCYLCTDQGRIMLVRLDRSKSMINKNFETVRKGDIINLESVVKKRENYWMITNNSKVQVMHSISKPDPDM